jgi:hypothetical protein
MVLHVIPAWAPAPPTLSAMPPSHSGLKSSVAESASARAKEDLSRAFADCDEDILRLSLADKVRNARSILRDLRKADIGEAVGGEHRAKPVPPEPDRLVAEVDPALGQQILGVAERQRISALIAVKKLLHGRPI